MTNQWASQPPVGLTLSDLSDTHSKTPSLASVAPGNLFNNNHSSSLTAGLPIPSPRAPSTPPPSSRPAGQAEQQHLFTPSCIVSPPRLTASISPTHAASVQERFSLGLVFGSHDHNNNNNNSHSHHQPFQRHRVQPSMPSLQAARLSATSGEQIDSAFADAVQAALNSSPPEAHPTLSHTPPSANTSMERGVGSGSDALVPSNQATVPHPMGPSSIHHSVKDEPHSPPVGVDIDTLSPTQASVTGMIGTPTRVSVSNGPDALSMTKTPSNKLKTPIKNVSTVTPDKASIANTKNNDVWPDDVEVAFWEALRFIPKLGRRKVLVHGKACGRNELIADYVFRKTGKQRSRKQVSSHIQVLKNVRKDDTEFLHLIAEPRTEEDFYVPAGGMMYALSLASSGYGGLSGPYGLPGWEAANDSTYSSVQQLHDPTLTPPPGPGDMPLIIPSSFSMWVHCSDSEERHTYVQMGLGDQPCSKVVAACKAVNTIHLGQVRFPQLARMYDQMDCPFLHLYAPLCIPHADVFLPDFDQFSTQLTLTSKSNDRLTSVNTVYSHGKRILTLVEPLEKPRQVPSASGTNKEGDGPTSSDSHRFAHYAPFATDFWADLLSRNHPVKFHKTNESPTFGKEPSERAALGMAVAGITLIQEIVLADENKVPPQSSKILSNGQDTHHSPGQNMGKVVLVLAWDMECVEKAPQGELPVPRISLLTPPTGPQNLAHQPTDSSQLMTSALPPPPYAMQSYQHMMGSAPPMISAVSQQSNQPVFPNHDTPMLRVPANQTLQPHHSHPMGPSLSAPEHMQTSFHGGAASQFDPMATQAIPHLLSLQDHPHAVMQPWSTLSLHQHHSASASASESPQNNLQATPTLLRKRTLSNISRDHHPANFPTRLSISPVPQGPYHQGHQSINISTPQHVQSYHHQSHSGLGLSGAGMVQEASDNGIWSMRSDAPIASPLEGSLPNTPIPLLQTPNDPCPDIDPRMRMTRSLSDYNVHLGVVNSPLRSSSTTPLGSPPLLLGPPTSGTDLHCSPNMLNCGPLFPQTRTKSPHSSRLTDTFRGFKFRSTPMPTVPLPDMEVAHVDGGPPLKRRASMVNPTLSTSPAPMAAVSPMPNTHHGSNSSKGLLLSVPALTLDDPCSPSSGDSPAFNLGSYPDLMSTNQAHAGPRTNATVDYSEYAPTF